MATQCMVQPRSLLARAGGARTHAVAASQKLRMANAGMAGLKSSISLHARSKGSCAAARGRAATALVQASGISRTALVNALAQTNLPGISSLERVTVLAEALPYLKRFHNKTIVIKYGGAAMKDPTLKAGVVSDLVLMSLVGIRPVLVHGGGPEINTWLGKLGIEAKFKNGLRVTDEATMEVCLPLLGLVGGGVANVPCPTRTHARWWRWCSWGT
mmetsp:Transcript_62273/g.197168  ORF Transcript_62273/g.197168 Transcript_62273/m.197168 type:complete len:215 (-) Transcript_62273:978-1622(-)